MATTTLAQTRSAVIRNASQLSRLKLGNWSTCLKLAWKKVKVFAKGIAKWLKKTTGQPRLAIIEPVGKYDWEYSGSEFCVEKPGLIRALDAQKLLETDNKHTSMISFYLQDLID